MGSNWCVFASVATVNDKEYRTEVSVCTARSAIWTPSVDLVPSLEGRERTPAYLGEKTLSKERRGGGGMEVVRGHSYLMNAMQS